MIWSPRQLVSSSGLLNRYYMMMMMRNVDPVGEFVCASVCVRVFDEGK